MTRPASPTFRFGLARFPAQLLFASPIEAIIQLGDEMGESEGLNPRIRLKILELRDHSYIDLGMQSFAVSPRVGETVALKDESDKDQMFEVLSIVHSPESNDVAGEITLIRIGDRKSVTDVLKDA